MKKIIILIIAAHCFCLLSACAIKPAITNQYKLASYNEKQLTRHSTHHSISISTPEAVSAYQTAQMLYVQKPFEISSFAHNAWISPPADMLFPLIVQSIERSGFFYAVTSTTNSEQTDYRLDTQLIELQQNFLINPSQLNFIVKVVLTHVPDKRVVASLMFSERFPCPTDTPYGGVIAANLATKQFTVQLTRFVINQVKHDRII